MTPLDEPLPFTKWRGTLYFAPLATPAPSYDLYRGAFNPEWPAGWLTAGRSDPEWCSATDGAWQIGLNEVAASLRWPPQTPFPARVMIGWQSDDRASRVIAAQTQFGEPVRFRSMATASIWPLTVILEQVAKDAAPYEVAYVGNTELRPMPSSPVLPAPCPKYYELADGEVSLDCDRERGHEPPHRGVRDYRSDGGGSLVTAEWWDHWGEEAGKRWN